MASDGNGEPDVKKPKATIQYELEADNQILADEIHQPMFQDLVDNYKVDYIPGGATQNTLRVASWITNVPKMASFFGCIAHDKFGDILKEKMVASNVHVDYLYDEKEPTGTCACVITGQQRSLVANLAAANCYKKEHLMQPENWANVEKASIYYVAGFHLTVAPDAMLALATHAKENNKTFCMNLSAPFLCQFFKEPQMKVLPYCDFIFGNETEAASFAKEQQLGTEDLKEVALKIAALPKKNDKRPRIVVITQGDKSTLIAQGGKLTEYEVEKVKTEDIVDTNGAGDAFVGGFLAQLVQEKSIAECVRCAHFAGSYIIQQSGITLDGAAAYE